MTQTATRRVVTTLAAGLAALVLVLPCAALADTSAAVRLTLLLADGSRLIGTPGAEGLALRTDIATLEVPFKAMQRAEFKSNREAMVVQMRNGDRLTGFLDVDSLELSALVGRVTVPFAQITTILVQTMRGGPAPKGLLLWNTLGSKAEIESSLVGPGGVCGGGDFGPGQCGQAFVVRCDQQRLVSFPVAALKPTAGCIEFWAKLTDMNAQLSWGRNPELVRISSGSDVLGFLHLNGNDGGSRGGLCSAFWCGSSGTGAYGSWSYEQVLGAGKAEDWHHYALVWDGNGISGVKDGQQRVAVYLDGVLNSSDAGVPGATPPSFKEAQLELLGSQAQRRGAVAFDNLKVWDFAKTDFGDRNEE